MTDAPRISPFKDLGPLSPLDPERTESARAHPARTTGDTSHACQVTVHAWDAPSFVSSHTIRHGPELVDRAPGASSVLSIEREDCGFHARIQVRLTGACSTYGLGEHAGPLLRDGRSHVLWNIDANGYDASARNLYQSHPWVLALREDGGALGVLVDSHRRGAITCHADGLELVFEGDPPQIVTLEADGPAEVLAGLAALVGPPPRFPRWALGYHQCRYSYLDADEVRETAERLREERIPCDAIWFDIDYMDRYRVFTWDAEAFPDPRALTDELGAMGMRSVAIVDPGIVDAEDDAVHRGAIEGDHLVATPDGGRARARVWPGVCHFPDFTRPETRAWWAGHVERFTRDSGLSGIWCDMNEPAVLGSPTRTLREDAVHRGDPSGPHAEVHNLYGHQMVVATREGLERALDGERPFVLTRSGTVATGAVAATWTGDNQSHWDDLRWSIPMVLNLGLSGQVMSGPDIGGFSGAPDEELFVRWFELGAFLPFCRGHAEKGTPRKEPWVFGAEATGHVRAALERRMRLVPTLASLLALAHETGIPVCRPVWFADPADARLRSIDDAFLVGGDLLVAPVVHAGERTRSVELAAGGWYRLESSGGRLDGARVEVDAPLGATPLFARAGGVLVEGSAAPSTSSDDGARTVTLWLDANGSAGGVHVEDDGTGSTADARIVLRAERTSDGARVEVEASAEIESSAWRFVVRDDRATFEAEARWTIASTPNR
ncbi:MAG: glycoside hydrolase family 31 protein [Planctomycetota bacterium]